MVRDHKMVGEERFPMTEQGYTTGKLLDGTECQILLDTGSSKSFMSKSHYLSVNHSTHYLNLHQNMENSSRQWTVCECTFCHSNNNRHSQSQNLRYTH